MYDLSQLRRLLLFKHVLLYKNVHMDAYSKSIRA
jgi:hypothetical protein